VPFLPRIGTRPTAAIARLIFSQARLNVSRRLPAGKLITSQPTAYKSENAASTARKTGSFIEGNVGRRADNRNAIKRRGGLLYVRNTRPTLKVVVARKLAAGSSASTRERVKNCCYRNCYRTR
jgi:hypothetical protein